MTMSPTDTAALTAPAAALVTRSLTLSVRTGTFGNSRQASLGQAKFTTDDPTAEPDKKLLTLSKTLIDSPELKAIDKYDSRTNTLLRKYGRSTMLRPGIVVVSMMQVPEIRTLLQERAAGRVPLIDEAVRMYPQRVRETIARLGVLGSPLDYMSVERFRSKFYFDWQFLQFATPEALREIGPDIYEEERAKLAAEMAALAEEARQTTRGLFLTMVKKLAERLDGTGADGQPKVFQKGTVEKLQAFINGFVTDHNLTNDTELAALVKDARGLLVGVPPSLLRENEAFREHTQKQLSTILEKLEPLVVVGERAISFMDDELAEAS